MMKTWNAYLCCNCDEVFEMTSRGLCPVCESKNSLSLNRIINGKEGEVRKFENSGVEKV